MTRPLLSYRAGDLVAGRYLVEAELAGGGMAVVYRARHTGTGRSCALKLIRPELVGTADLAARFAAEARVAGQLGSHPHIVDVFDSAVDERDDGTGRKIGVPFIAMEWLAGDTLGALILRHGALPHPLAAELARQLADALDHAHRAGVVHRDLKSSNVIVSRSHAGEPCAKILDFGIAKLLETVGTTTATSIGTPVYASPEQLGASVRRLAAERGIALASEVSPATDVWALALICYEMLTGTPPGHYWGSRELGDLVVQIALEPRARPSERAGARAASLPAGFDDWFVRATAHAASARFPSAGEAVRALFGAAVEGARAPTPVPSGARAAAPEPSGARTSGGTEIMAPAPAAREPDWLPAPSGARPGETVLGTPATLPSVGSVVGTGTADGPAPPSRPLHDPFFRSAETPAPDAPARSARRLLPWLLVGSAATLTLGIALAVYFATRPSTRAVAPPPEPTSYGWSDDAPVAVSSRDPSWGERDAPVTLVVFCDLESEPCARLVGRELPPLRTRFGPKQLRIVWKHNPASLGPSLLGSPTPSPASPGAPAHEAAQEIFRLAGSTAFFKFVALAFEHQSELRYENYAEWAGQVGVEPARFRAERDADLDQQKVALDVALARRVGAETQPTVFLNCTHVDARTLAGTAPGPSAPGELLAELVEAELRATGATAAPSPATSGTAYAARCRASYRTPEQRKADELANAVRLLTGDWEDSSTAYRTVTRVALTDGRPAVVAVWEREGSTEIFQVRSTTFEQGVLRWSYYVPSTGYTVSHEVLSVTAAGLRTHWTNNWGGSGDTDLVRTETSGPPPPPPPPPPDPVY
ncbi:MAG: protein kinase [Myxococcales bacterium]|nr:protein kinase [Myxococcales bacterium]